MPRVRQRQRVIEDAAISLPDISGLKVTLRAIDTLRSNPCNARIHSKKQVRQIANSFLTAGVLTCLVVDENSIVLAGNGRLAAAKLLGMPRVPVLEIKGLTDLQKRAFALADNKICENGGWDREILGKELGELIPQLEGTDWGISVTGFEPHEIDTLFSDLTESHVAPEEKLPPVENHAVSRPGDLWILGRHRLICANARSQPELDRLMNGGKADAVCADVPYNKKVSEVQGRGRIKHPEFVEASGEQTSAEYTDFLTVVLGNAARVSRDGAVHYVFHDWRHSSEIHAAGRAVYGAMLALCVWAKTCAGQGSFYRSQHEFVGVFRVGQNSHQNNVQLGRFGRNRSNLWTYAGMSGFGAGRMELLAMHPTVKPVALIADAMRDCTTRGDIVLDPFMGSGTTIIAAEKIGRRGYGVEYEPRYVDVAIRRWQAFTKAEAVLDGDGRTFDEVKAERMREPPSQVQACAPSGDADE